LEFRVLALPEFPEMFTAIATSQHITSSPVQARLVIDGVLPPWEIDTLAEGSHATIAVAITTLYRC